MSKPTPLTDALLSKHVAYPTAKEYGEMLDNARALEVKLAAAEQKLLEVQQTVKLNQQWWDKFKEKTKELVDALQANQVFHTPIALRRRGGQWDEYELDAIQRTKDVLGADT